MEAEPRRTPIRERFREQVREDVKTIALQQLADGGAQAISLNAIAKELGVSGPALYRYFANRDELLSSLVVDAYSDLRDALAGPAGTGEHEADGRRAGERRAVGHRAAEPRADEPGAGEHGANVSTRIRRLARAYRGWAREQPHRYELLFKPPLPGYDAHSAQLSEAGRSLMGVVLGELGGSRASSGPLDNAEVLDARSTGAPDFQLAVRVWSRLHGFVSLELGGAYTAMSVDADALFDTELDVLTDGAGSRL